MRTRGNGFSSMRLQRFNSFFKDPLATFFESQCGHRSQTHSVLLSCSCVGLADVLRVSCDFLQGSCWLSSFLVQSLVFVLGLPKSGVEDYLGTPSPTSPNPIVGCNSRTVYCFCDSSKTPLHASRSVAWTTSNSGFMFIISSTTRVSLPLSQTSHRNTLSVWKQGSMCTVKYTILDAREVLLQGRLSSVKEEMSSSTAQRIFGCSTPIAHRGHRPSL